MEKQRPYNISDEQLAHELSMFRLEGMREKSQSYNDLINQYIEGYDTALKAIEAKFASVDARHQQGS